MNAPAPGSFDLAAAATELRFYELRRDRMRRTVMDLEAELLKATHELDRVETIVLELKFPERIAKLRRHGFPV